jgi:hypothetical protein
MLLRCADRKFKAVCGQLKLWVCCAAADMGFSTKYEHRNLDAVVNIIMFFPRMMDYWEFLVHMPRCVLQKGPVCPT